jgi:hypothetical protein
MICRPVTRTHRGSTAAVDTSDLDALLLSSGLSRWISDGEIGMKIDETMEMAYPQKLALNIIIGIADPINEHLAKLIAFRFHPQLRYHFRAELRSWLNKIQRIRLKPNARTESFKFYFDPLFDYPFGGVEIHNTRALIEFISSEYDGIRPTISPEEMAIWLKEFHTKLAQALHNGEAVLDMVPE